MRICVFTALLVLLVVGCGVEQSESEPNPTPSSAPTPTLEATPTSTPDPTPTTEAVPTPTPQSTETPEPTVVPTHTPVPPPSTVRNLRVINVTEDSITLQWEPPANSDLVSVEQYEVTRDVSISPDEHHFVLETTFTDVGLREGTEHKYRVRAIGAGGIKGTETSIEESTLESPTPEPTETPVPEPAATDTPQPTVTPSPSPTSPAMATPTPPAGLAPVPTATPKPTEVLTPEPTATVTPEPTTTASPVLTGTWYGLVVAPEGRCSPYDSDDYPYPQSVEARIVEGMGGIIYGPYTGIYFSSTKETDIEHIVARSEAHDSGLCAADAGTRSRFASDLLNLTLASPGVNRHQKSDNDAAEWLPDLNKCWYADRVVRVRQEYGLTIDQNEVDALEAILSGCSSFEMVVAPATDQASPSATPTARPTPSPTPHSSSNVDALAIWDDNGDGRITCAEARRHGIAPVRRGHPAYPYMNDRDGDGVVCE